MYIGVCCAFYLRTDGPADLLNRSLRADAGSPEQEEAAIRAELGHGVWNMLHRMAAQYDKQPSADRQAQVTQFFELFGQFYPCEKCAAHFRAMLAEHPVEAADNRALSLWLCKLHNKVNVRLMKPEFPCTLEALKERWGSCGCFDGANATET